MIHIYRSTACLHKLHKECRRNCKFCNEPCDCPCHAVENSPTLQAGGLLAMIAKKTTVIVSRPFRDKDGKDHKPGDRIEVDPGYGQEIIRDGNGRDEASQLPADQPPPAQPK